MGRWVPEFRNDVVVDKGSQFAVAQGRSPTRRQLLIKSLAELPPEQRIGSFAGVGKALEQDAQGTEFEPRFRPLANATNAGNDALPALRVPARE